MVSIHFKRKWVKRQETGAIYKKKQTARGCQRKS